MEDRDYLIILYDIYGDLLNDRQREYFESYYFQNLSLSEIGDNFGISRNAVHKVIQGVNDKLNFYEEKLALFSKNKLICDIIKLESDSKIKEMLQELL